MWRWKKGVECAVQLGWKESAYYTSSKVSWFKRQRVETDRRMDTTDCSTFLANTVASGGSTLGLGGQAPKSWLCPPNLAVLLTHCGQLIQRKISKFDATRCHILRLTQTHTRLTALCPGLPGWAGTRKVNQTGFYWSKRQWVAVASAGPYASLHLAPGR